MTFDQRWQKILSERSWGKYPSESVIRFVARHFYLSPNRMDIKILDLGCGGGAHTLYLAKEGFSTYAIDGSVSALDQTKLLLEKEGYSAELKNADIALLDYPAKYFDAVIDSNTIQHNRWNDILKIYTEIKRVLKPGGMHFSMIVNDYTSGSDHAQKIEENTFVNINNKYITTGVLTHYLTEKEFEILSEQYVDIDVEIQTRTDFKIGDRISHYIWSGKLK